MVCQLPPRGVAVYLPSFANSSVVNLSMKVSHCGLLEGAQGKLIVEMTLSPVKSSATWLACEVPRRAPITKNERSWRRQAERPFRRDLKVSRLLRSNPASQSPVQRLRNPDGLRFAAQH